MTIDFEAYRAGRATSCDLRRPYFYIDAGHCISSTFSRISSPKMLSGSQTIISLAKTLTFLIISFRASSVLLVSSCWDSPNYGSKVFLGVKKSIHDVGCCDWSSNLHSQASRVPRVRNFSHYRIRDSWSISIVDLLRESCGGCPICSRAGFRSDQSMCWSVAVYLHDNTASPVYSMEAVIYEIVPMHVEFSQSSHLTIGERGCLLIYH